MTSPLTYHASQAHIDDLLREAADYRRVHDAPAVAHSRLTRMLQLPQQGFGKVMRALSSLVPRPATH